MKSGTGSDFVSRLSDDELIAQCARGDRRAMDALVSRYHGKLLDFAFRHLEDRDTAADIAQAAFIRVFENAQSYRQKTSFRSWLYTVALNLIRDHCRRRKVRKESLEPDVIEHETAESTEDTVLRGLNSAAVWQAVKHLPENQQTALILKFRQELTYDEIAAVMDAPSGTVKSWVYYGLRTLRQHLDPLKCEG